MSSQKKCNSRNEEVITLSVELTKGEADNQKRQCSAKMQVFVFQSFGVG